MRTPLSIAAPSWDDVHFAQGILEQFPRLWQYRFAHEYARIRNEKSRQAANLFLLERQEKIKQHPVGLGSSDDDIQAYAKRKARRYFEKLTETDDYEQLYKNICTEVERLGVQAPKMKENSTYESLCKRFADVAWWRRALRIAINRHVEHEAIKAGMVGGRTKYVSSETLGRIKAADRRNSQLLTMIEAVNDAGYVATLADLSAAGVSNPSNRKDELMTRMRGIEEEAKRKGLACEFYTLTCPSKYHATSGGEPNEKYLGYSPKEAQAYLNDVYARIRAKLKREKINPVGFRVAEPHGDACPHWHLVLFVERKVQPEMRAIFRHYALLEDGEENGAQQHRFTAKWIDLHKGSAAGYIAKYISKNVSMEGLDDFESHEGGSVTEGLERATAWARVWGIRQFQQTGGERITVWRELRRIRDEQGLAECIKPLWRAADTGEYGVFLREALSRKITMLRDDEKEVSTHAGLDCFYYAPDEKGQFTQPAWRAAKEVVTGFVNRYGEQVAGAVRGLVIDGVELITRVWSWAFTYKPEQQQKIKPNQNIQTHVETGAKRTITPDRMRAFNSFLWELCALNRKGLKGYPRQSRLKMLAAKPPTLGLV